MVFFSGTDTDEIVDNSANHDMYLSVIVNNTGDVCAKIAFRGKYKVVAENKYSYKNILGTIIDKIINVNTEEDVVYIAEMKLQDEPETVEQYFIDRVVAVKDSKKKRALPVKYTGYNDRLPFEDDFNGKYGYNQQHTTTKYKPYTGGMLTDPQVYSFILKVICIDETEFTYSRVDFEKKAKKCVEDKVKECVNGSLVDLYLNACDDVIEDMFSIFLGTPFDSKNKLHIDKFVDACERAEWNMQQILKEFDKDNKAFEESDLCGELVEMFKLFPITYEMEEVKVEEIVD